MMRIVLFLSSLVGFVQQIPAGGAYYAPGIGCVIDVTDNPSPNVIVARADWCQDKLGGP